MKRTRRFTGNPILFCVLCVLLFAGSCAGKEDAGPPIPAQDLRAEGEAEGMIRTELSDGKMEKLEKGLSAARIGDCGFDGFLAGGGASSDREVLSYLTGMLRAGNLYFSIPGMGCSTLAVQTPEGGWLFGRNFDWNKCDALILEAHPADGYASFSTVNLDFIRASALLPLPEKTLLTAACYAPLDGMNEKGLCVSVNMISDRDTIDQRTDKPDLTTTTAVRLLLDRAADTDEAVRLLGEYDLHASFGYMVHFALSDASGHSAAVEYVGGEMTVIETPILTNFYLAEGEKQGIGTAQSHTRYEILESFLAAHETASREEVMDALSSVSKGNFGEFESTEWSVVYDPTGGTATWTHRENYEKSWTLILTESEDAGK